MLRTLPSESVQCCVCSPPYWGLRDYGVDGQMGLEKTPEEYVAGMVKVFTEVRRVLRDDGTLWVNIGDSYGGSGKGGNPEQSEHQKQKTNRGSEVIVRSKRIERGSGRWGGGNNPATGSVKPKDLVGIPWLLAFALRADGWYLRQEIIWHKPSCMPESVTDRCTKSHEQIFLLSKNATYFFDNEAIKEPSEYPDDDRKGRSYDHHKSAPTEERNGVRPGNYLDSGRAGYATRNKRSVWSVTNCGYHEAHFATYPPDLIKPCILAGCPISTCSVCGMAIDLADDNTSLSPMQCLLQNISIEEKTVEILQPEMHMEGKDAATRQVSALPSNHPTDEAYSSQSVLFENLRESMDGKATTTQDANDERVRAHLETRSSTDDKRGVYDGASLGNGALPETAPEANRNCAPRQRQQIRQQNPQLATNEQTQTRPSSQAQKSVGLPEVRSHHRQNPLCPNCGADLNVSGAICPGVVLDPFAGSGTTGMVALELGRKAVLIELNPAYVKLIEQRCHVTPGLPL